MTRGGKPHFSETDDEAIERLYLSGATVDQIADRYGVSQTPVRKALKRRQVTSRVGARQTRWTGSDEQRQQVLEMHRNRVSVREIERSFAVSFPVITNVLRDNGITVRPGGRRPARFNAEQSAEIGRLYADGMSLTALAQRYDTNPVTIRNTLGRIGVPMRAKGREKFWTEARIAWAAEQYRAGRSQQSIADELGVDQSSVSARLMTAGVVTRRPRTRGESHPSWKGGRHIDGNGYVRVKPSPEDEAVVSALIGGYVLEHRLVMGRALGRPLTKRESVHHINGDRTDNRLENLQLRQGNHGNGVVMTCKDCGSHNIEATPLS